jgi:hypothetical protein
MYVRISGPWENSAPVYFHKFKSIDRINGIDPAVLSKGVGQFFNLNRNSERIARSLLRGERANDRSIKIPYGEDSLQLAAG